MPYIPNVNDVFTMYQFRRYIRLMSLLVLEKIAGNRIAYFLVFGKIPDVEFCLYDQMRRIDSF